jgi:hypothetical protein
MAYRRAERPLDPNAVATANQQLWSQFPELKGRQLTPDDDVKYRSYWMDQYEKAGGTIQKPKPLPPKTPTQPCVPKEPDDAPTVKITEPPCRFIAKGKKRKIKAVGQAPGGSYHWTTKGSVSVASGGNTDEVEVSGGGPSHAIDDSELTVEYTLKGKTAKDTIKLTAYEINKVEAKLRGTPCKRTGSRADTMPAKSSTSDSKVFGPTAVTIVKGCGDLHLTATVAPAAVPVSWAVERAADDDGSLSGTPTDADDGGATKRKVTADATGSFHVMVFHDCTKAGKPDAADALIVLNLNIIDLQITQNDIITRNTKFTDGRSNAASLVVDSGTPTGPGVNTAYTDAEFTKHALSMKVTVKLVGGGANERRGTDKVRLGYIQTTTADSFAGSYGGGKTLKEVIAEDPTIASPITGGAPAMLAFPVRDARDAGNSGSGPFINSSSDVDKSEPASGGLQRVVRYIDSPAIALRLSHPVSGSALASISGSNNFDVFLCAYSADFDENYTVAASAAWSATYGSYTAAGGWNKTGADVTPHAPAKMTEHSPPKRGEDLNIERCPPNFVDNLKMDAR